MRSVHAQSLNAAILLDKSFTKSLSYKRKFKVRDIQKPESFQYSLGLTRFGIEGWPWFKQRVTVIKNFVKIKINTYVFLLVHQIHVLAANKVMNNTNKINNALQYRIVNNLVVIV